MFARLSLENLEVRENPTGPVAVDPVAVTPIVGTPTTEVRPIDSSIVTQIIANALTAATSGW